MGGRWLAASIVAWILCGKCAALADVSLPAVISSDMVLQRDQATPIWGWADPGEVVSVEFAGQTKTVSVGKTGTWMVKLAPMKASAEPRELKVSEITLTNVLVGDVWICSGQSNMDMTLSKSKDGAATLRATNDPHLRVIKVMASGRPTPTKTQTKSFGQWAVASPETVKEFSAAAYYFGRRLREELNDVPIGLIQNSASGTKAEQWTSREALMANPGTRPLWSDFQRRLDEFDPVTETPAQVANNLRVEWLRKATEARKNKRPQPPRPTIVVSPLRELHAPTNMYNAKLHSIIPFAMRGFVWYQGEGNCDRGEHYKTLLPVMIADWRARWSRPDAPFYIVQIANIGLGRNRLEDSDWNELQWSQFQVARDTPDSGLVVINDYPANDTSLHPHDKQRVGDRLARLALARAYEKSDVACSGPLYRKSQIKGRMIHIYFDYAEGLRSSDGKPLQSFQIAGADRKWVWANASIDGETVVVSSPEIRAPVAVRYAWSKNPAGANLTNGSGLPASLFKTDDWPGVTRGKVLP